MALKPASNKRTFDVVMNFRNILALLKISKIGGFGRMSYLNEYTKKQGKV